MRVFFLGLVAWCVLTFPVANRAQAQVLNYNTTVVNTGCVTNTTCVFTFPAFSGSTQVLTVAKVSCRVVTPTTLTAALGIVYAALGKSSSTTKIEFLTAQAFLYGTGTPAPYVVSIIDETTLFFVGADVSPLITIATQEPMVAPNSTLDQPTCTVTGYVQ
jgi:hypothetical protein